MFCVFPIQFSFALCRWSSLVLLTKTNGCNLKMFNSAVLYVRKWCWTLLAYRVDMFSTQHALNAWYLPKRDLVAAVQPAALISQHLCHRYAHKLALQRLSHISGTCSGHIHTIVNVLWLEHEQDICLTNLTQHGYGHPGVLATEDSSS